MKTALCHTLGIEHPIIAAPMGPDLSGPELVAAVSNAGGLGILQAQFCPPPRFREEIRRVRTLTAKPFGTGTQEAIFAQTLHWLPWYFTGTLIALALAAARLNILHASREESPSNGASGTRNSRSGGGWH